MRLLVVWAIAALLFALPLAAEFEATVSGSVQEYRSPVPGVEVTVKLDPYWGQHNLERLEKFAREHGELPEVTITGSDTTDEKGVFEFKVKITTSGDGKLPTREFKDNKGNTISYEYVPCTVTATKPGYLPAARNADLSERYKSHTYFELKQMSFIKGEVLHITGRRPAANLPLLLQRWQGLEPKDRLEFKTDSEGRFEVNTDALVSTGCRLQVAGHEFAFASSSKAWQGMHINPGTLDLGTLIIVPGGAFKATAKNLDTREGLPGLSGELKTLDKPREVRIGFWGDSNGSVHLSGVPAGRYSLTMRVPSNWVPELNEIEVKPGEVIDLGDTAFEPHRELELMVAGVERFQATATYLGDAAPPEARHGNYAHTVRKDLTVENSKLGPLFTGEWLVRVSAPNYAEYSSTIAVPADGPLTVEMAAAGEIQVKSEDGNGAELRTFWCVALRHGSKAHELLAELPQNELKDYVGKTFPLPPGMYNWESRSKSIKSLPSGTYLVRADGDGFWALYADDIEVVAGEVVTATLTPLPCRLEALVLDAGKPVPDFAVSFILHLRNALSVPVSVTTDADGIAVTEWATYGEVYILTEVESAWLAAQDLESGALSDNNFPGRRVHVRPGHKLKLELELRDPDKVLVKFNVELPERQSVARLSLDGVDPDSSRRRRFLCARVGNQQVAVCVPKGKYSVSVWVKGVQNRSGSHQAEVVVDQLREQTFELQPVLPMLEVSVNAPGIAAEDLRLRLEPAEMPERRWDEEEHWVLASLDGPTLIDCLAPGQYILRVHALETNGNVRLAARRRIEVHEDSKVEILLTDDVGSLDVELVGKPASPADRYRVPVTVYFKKATGEFVVPGDSTLASRHERKFSIPSVPSGTYTVIVTAGGFQPYETRDVVIAKGKATALKATPELAGALVVTVKDVLLDHNSEVSWTMEDKDGNPIELLLPDGGIAAARFRHRSATLELINLTPDVKQVRIRIKGHEDIVVKTDVKPGETISADASAKAK